MNFRPGNPRWAGLRLYGARCFRGTGDAGGNCFLRRNLKSFVLFRFWLRPGSFTFLAFGVTGAMNKKKKPFLGMPAPLGYVPGLGRG